MTIWAHNDLVKPRSKLVAFILFSAAKKAHSKDGVEGGRKFWIFAHKKNYKCDKRLFTSKLGMLSLQSCQCWDILGRLYISKDIIKKIMLKVRIWLTNRVVLTFSLWEMFFSLFQKTNLFQGYNFFFFYKFFCIFIPFFYFFKKKKNF